MASSRAAQALRGVLAAFLSTFVALLSHVAGGGEMPALMGVLVPLVLASAACVLLAGRRMSILRLSLSVVISQLLFHTLFVLGAGGQVVTAAPSGHAGHGAEPVLLTSMPGMAGHSHATMWVAHAFAAVITIVAIYHGERVVEHVRTFTSAIVRVLILTVPVAETPSKPALSGFEAVLLPSSLSVFASTHAHRGPPVLSFS